MDIFDIRGVSPMLLSEQREPFDSDDYIFELKLDGLRCLAYIDASRVDLRNKRNVQLNATYPELADIFRHVKSRCILDGELFIMRDGKPDFEELQRRAMLTDKFKIRIGASRTPATFTAFDIVYKDDGEIIELPLMQRKEILRSTVDDAERIAVSRYIERDGIAFYSLTEQNELEGIVAKLKSSQYFYGKRSKDWIKIKYLKDEDFIACGYIRKAPSVMSIVLGKQSDAGMEYAGHVTLGVPIRTVERMDTTPICPFPSLPAGNEQAVWFATKPLCAVQYMERTSNGGMRQPVFKGFRV